MVVYQHHHDDITFHSNITFYPNRQVRQGQLQGVTSIVSGTASISYGGNTTIYFYQSGQVSNGVLSSNHTISSNDYYDGNRLYLNLDGSVNVISSFVMDSSLAFYPDGRVRSGRLNSSHWIGSARWTSNTALSFFSNGQVDNGQLSGRNIVAQVGYSNTTRLYFYQSGQVSNGFLDGVQNLSNARYSNNISFIRSIFYYESGQVMDGRLNTNQNIDGAIYLSNNNGASVGFYSNGQISLGQLATSSNLIQGNYFGPGIMRFYPSGRVSNTILSGIQTFTGINYNGEAYFHDVKGIIERGIIAEQYTIDGIMMRAGVEVVFYDNGRLSRGFTDQVVTIDGVEYGPSARIYL